MTSTSSTSRPTAVRRNRDRRGTLIAGDDLQFATVRPRLWDLLLTRLGVQGLDTQLATGLPPDGSRRRALRAAELVTPETRERLAGNWEQMLDRALAPRRSGDPSAPLARGRIFAARDDIRQLVAALRIRRPVPARGVAMARLLLTDGSGPLYRSRSRVELTQALLETRNQLDPANTLFPFDAITGDPRR
jgi:hypothetical protein